MIKVQMILKLQSIIKMVIHIRKCNSQIFIQGLNYIKKKLLTFLSISDKKDFYNKIE